MIQAEEKAELCRIVPHSKTHKKPHSFTIIGHTSDSRKGSQIQIID
jgi:hypothetical protein